MALSPYAFRPFEHADLTLVRPWLETAEVSAWWEDPDHQLQLLAEDLDEPCMAQWIVSLEGRPFAYIQDYDPSAWGVEALADLPRSARGVDQFIGVPELIGRGHGSAFIRQHALWLIGQGAPLVFTDPDPANGRAVRAYEKVGFVARGVRALSEGDCLIMTFTG